ncbi:MAG: hypothetical protein OEQ28_14180 [Acidobacteriota bacterium]|nr:hypothetical protein [Acidobacteriota bacterium]
MSDFVEQADGPSARSPAIEENLSISSHQRSMSDFVEQADGPSARSPAIEEDLSISSHQRSMSDFVEQADGPSALPVKSFDSFFDAFSARPHDRLRSKKTCPSQAIIVLCPTSSNKRTGRPRSR